MYAQFKCVNTAYRPTLFQTSLISEVLARDCVLAFAKIVSLRVTKDDDEIEFQIRSNSIDDAKRSHEQISCVCRDLLPILSLLSELCTFREVIQLLFSLKSLFSVAALCLFQARVAM